MRISIGAESYSTKAAKGTLSPVWNQSFTMYCTHTLYYTPDQTYRDVLPSQALKLSVWNMKKFAKKQHTGFMGSVDLPLAFAFDLEPGKTVGRS